MDKNFIHKWVKKDNFGNFLSKYVQYLSIEVQRIFLCLLEFYYLFFVEAVVTSSGAVPELCFLCGSAGQEVTMLRCLACCEPAHPFCLSQVWEPY
jgi:hypothetical protein